MSIETGFWLSAAVLVACIIGWLTLKTLSNSRGLLKVEVHSESDLVTPKLSAAMGRFFLIVGFVLGLWAPRDGVVLLTGVAALLAVFIVLHMWFNPGSYASPFAKSRRDGA